MIPADRQGGNRARRGPHTDVIYGESETFWEAVPKVGKQQKLIAYTNWLAGEQEDQLPIVPEDIPDPCLEAVPAAFHQLFEQGRYHRRNATTDVALFKGFPLSWMGSASGQEEK
jgi:hypothetical protein